MRLAPKAASSAAYRRAVATLNTLQSNAADLARNPEHNSAAEMQHFVAALGLPLHELRVVHVAGTKGKGSVCAVGSSGPSARPYAGPLTPAQLVASALRQHGFSVGVFTSPHLVADRERIAIDGRALSQADFASSFDRVYSVRRGARPAPSIRR